MATVSRTFSVRNGLDVANTVVLDSNRNLTNIANVNATSFVTSAGLNVTDQANNAYAAANAAANTVRVSVNSAATLSGKQLNFVNTATSLITLTDSGDGNANIAITVVGGGAIGQAYDQANAAYAQANAARDQANTAYGQANDAYGQANTAYGQANNAYGQANLAYGQANTAYGQANDAYAQANTARDQANAAYAQANAAYGQANLAYGQANSARDQANAAYSTANLKVASIAVSGNGLAVSNTTSANLNDYTISVNTASTTLRGTTLLIDDINSSDTGNAATANAVKTAWDYANTKLSTSGGTINGTLNVSGNLFVTGNTTFINVSTYAVDDSLIYLAANNILTDVVDIGFVGAKNSGASVTHTGLARDAGDGTWYLFDNLADSGHQNNVIDFANSTYALLQANIYAQRLNVVTGFANIAVPLTVTGNTTLTANLVAQQNVNVTGTLNVAGLTEFTNNVALTIANVSTTLNVAGNTLLSTTNVNGALTITHTGEGLVVANANVTNKLTVGSLAITTNTITTSSTGQVVLDKFATTAFASAKYFVQANSGVDYTTTEVIVVQDGTNVWLTEYGTIQTGPSLGTFSADIDTGDVRLLFNANNNINTIRSIRYGVLPP